jgi:hypothetical protein
MEYKFKIGRALCRNAKVVFGEESASLILTRMGHQREIKTRESRKTIVRWEGERRPRLGSDEGSQQHFRGGLRIVNGVVLQKHKRFGDTSCLFSSQTTAASQNSVTYLCPLSPQRSQFASVLDPLCNMNGLCVPFSSASFPSHPSKGMEMERQVTAEPVALVHRPWCIVHCSVPLLMVANTGQRAETIFLKGHPFPSVHIPY